MQVQEESMIMASSSSNHVFKGKRTKRQRTMSSSFLLTIPTAATSCTSGPEANSDSAAHVFLRLTPNNYSTTTPEACCFSSSRSDSGELAQSSLEEEDMANCLILLAQGTNAADTSQKPQPSSFLIWQSPSPSPPPPPAACILNRPALDHVYQCKTCNRCFPSFQALGGHRASHKKPKTSPEEKSPAAALLMGSHESSTSTHVRFINLQQDFDDTTLSLQINPPAGRDQLCSGIVRSNNNNNNNNNSSNKSTNRVHECSICGAEFSSGQALGGHMRRHRPLPSAASSSSTNNDNQDSDHQDHHELKKPRTSPSTTLLSLDLNLPAEPEPDEEDCRELKYSFTSKQEAKMVFTASPSCLVDCHY